MDSLGIKEGILLLKKLISTLKAGDYAIYLDYVILGQLILANNCPLYNTKNGYFRGVKKWLAYIMIRGIQTRPSPCTVTTSKGLKSCTEVLNIHFQIFFKVLFSRNIQKCQSKKK